MDHGHPEASSYPFGMVWDEAESSVDRINAQTVTETVLMQMAVGSILSKKAGAELKKILKGLSSGE